MELFLCLLIFACFGNGKMNEIWKRNGNQLDAQAKLVNDLSSLRKTRDVECTNDDVILSNLLKAYDKHQLPDANGVKVKVMLFIQSVASVSELDMDMEFNMYAWETWLDKRLAFQGLPCNNNITLTSELSDQLWNPQTTFTNHKAITAPTKETHTTVYANGTVVTNRRIRVKAPCSGDLVTYPVYQLECSLFFESFPYRRSSVELQWSEDGVLLLNSHLGMNGFILSNVTLHGQIVEYPAGAWTELQFTLILKRATGWHLLHFYIPTGFILLASWASAALGVKGSGARLLLYGGSIVAMLFVHRDATKSAPRVSYLTAIDAWLLMCLGLLTLSILELAVVSLLIGSGKAWMGERCRGCDGALLSYDDGGSPTGHYPKFTTDEHNRRNAHKHGQSKAWRIIDIIDKAFGLFLALLFIIFNIVYWVYWV